MQAVVWNYLLRLYGDTVTGDIFSFLKGSIMANTKSDGAVLECSGITTRDWYAWLNLMPPGPCQLHVSGEIQVPNPGVDPLITPREPQGINPAVFLLDLYLVQRPGLWPDVLVWKQVRYDKVLPSKQEYSEVQIFCGDIVIATIPVQEAH